MAISITNDTGIDSSALQASALGSLSAAAHCISVAGWCSAGLILVAGAARAEAEWSCFSGRMSHLGLDTLWCLKHTLKCDTPSTYLLAAHNNLSAGLLKGARRLSAEFTGFDVVWRLHFDMDSRNSQTRSAV